MFRLKSCLPALLSSLTALCTANLAAQPATPSAKPEPAVLPVANATIPTRVVSQSPADTVTELQIVCLFHSDSANSLHGALLETNEKLKGILDKIRRPERFAGDLGETLLIAPPPGTLGAKRLLIIGLGDSPSFTPERMELVGAIAFREANRIGVAHPFFAPTVLDGGVTKFTTADTAEHVILGFLRAADTEKLLAEAGESAGVTVSDLTMLAGVKYASITHDGIAKAFAEHTSAPASDK